MIFKDERACSYLKGEICTTHYQICDLSASEYSALLERGWRRFGKFFFTNNCQDCSACKNLRIDIQRFVFTRSFKRVLRNASAISTVIRRPIITDEHLALFELYHEERAATRGWERDTDNDRYSYSQTFLEGSEEFGFEFAYYLNNRLLGVALVDMLPIGLSAVYCYYDPNYSHLSIGTFSILKQIQYSIERGLPHLYLGFWIKDNQSLQYKQRFKPYELLHGHPSVLETPHWR
jgi:arginine-tRNA-protein transferase